MVTLQSPLPWLATVIWPAGAPSGMGCVDSPFPVCTLTAIEELWLADPTVEGNRSAGLTWDSCPLGSRRIIWHAEPPALATDVLGPSTVWSPAAELRRAIVLTT